MGLQEDAANAFRTRKLYEESLARRKEQAADERQAAVNQEKIRAASEGLTAWATKLGVIDQVRDVRLNPLGAWFKLDGIECMYAYSGNRLSPYEQGRWRVCVVGNELEIGCLADLGQAISELPAIKEAKRLAEDMRNWPGPSGGYPN